MKYSLLLILLPLLACVTGKGYDLPKTWTKDFSISVYEGGGMLYASLDVAYTSDSCVYDHMQNGVHEVKRFKLSDSEKTTILNKLHEYKLGSVRTRSIRGTVYDKATTKICLTQQPKLPVCMENSASKMIFSNSDGFYKAYTYLVDFAKNHS